MSQQRPGSGVGQLRLQHQRNFRAGAVVAAQRVAVPDDQHAIAPPAVTGGARLGGLRPAGQRCTLRTSEPSAARISTCIGIWPTACVEQLRHGSKHRITASTRLSMPGSTLSPCT